MRRALLWGRLSVVVGACVLLHIMVDNSKGEQYQFRAVWADAFHEGFKSTEQIDNMVSRAVAGRYNAIIAEVLANHDNRGGGHGAYWSSGIVPKAPDIVGGIDPLAYLVVKAHAAGIEVHAWLLAYRSCSVWPPSGNTILSQHPEWIAVPMANMGNGVSAVGGVYQLDAGSPEVQEYVVSIVRELVGNYEIDGIHWDYIRYTTTNAGYPSDLSYARSGLARFKEITGYSDTPPSTGEQAWDDFRRREISELIRRCRAEIPSIATNPRQPLRHTAAVIPWGDAPTDFTLTSAYKSCYQDWRLWMEQGWLDAACPMLYYREYRSDQMQWFRNWVDAAVAWKYQRHLYTGQGNYMNTMADSVVQMQYAYAQGAEGTVNFSYASTADENIDGNTENNWAWYPFVASYLFTAPAALPIMPWRNPATAVEGTLWGQVTEEVTGLPVDNATVAVGTLPSVQTDGNGYFVVTMVPCEAAGTDFDVTVAKNGYELAAHTGVQVVAGDIRRNDFVLTSTGLRRPVITEQPQPQEVELNATAIFTLVAVGVEPLTYQWQKDRVDLVESQHDVGVATATLTIVGVSATDVGKYRCLVSNPGGTTLSREVDLIIKEPLVEFIVESRMGGQNYDHYSEVGYLYDSTAKSGAAGTTSEIGSRWGYLELATYGLSKAIYSYTPDITGVYEVFVTWPTSSNASNLVEHIVTHRDGTTSLFMDQDRYSNPGGANNWNSMGQYVLTANRAYTVTQTNENQLDQPEIFRADSVKWRLVSRTLPERIQQFTMDTDPGWSTEDQWMFGPPLGGGGSHGGPDPIAGHTGSYVYGYNLEGDYSSGMDEKHLTTTAINCTGMSHVVLKFWRWLGVEGPSYDHACIRISNNKINWVTVWENSGTIADVAWIPQQLDISAVADNQPTVYIRWTMGPTDDSWEFCGWNIDDVEIWGTPNPTLPPNIVSAVSRKTHATAGVFDVDLLHPSGSGSMGVEARQGGPTEILVTFSEPIQGVDGLDDNDVALSSGNVASVQIDDRTLRIRVNEVINASPLTISFPGIALASDSKVLVEAAICFGVLAGDVTGDQRVNVLDLLATRSTVNLPVTASRFRPDVNMDGRINVVDLLAIKGQLNKVTEDCP